MHGYGRERRLDRTSPRRLDRNRPDFQSKFRAIDCQSPAGRLPLAFALDASRLLRNGLRKTVHRRNPLARSRLVRVGPLTTLRAGWNACGAHASVWPKTPILFAGEVRRIGASSACTDCASCSSAGTTASTSACAGNPHRFIGRQAQRLTHNAVRIATSYSDQAD
jgi:hypothetical protein